MYGWEAKAVISKIAYPRRQERYPKTRRAWIEVDLASKECPISISVFPASTDAFSLRGDLLDAIQGGGEERRGRGWGKEGKKTNQMR